MDPAKLKVVELRAELSQRGLDTKGNKAVLVERLRKALDQETEENETTDTVVKSDDEHADNNSTTLEQRDKSPEPAKPLPSPKTPARVSRNTSSTTPVKTSSRAGSRSAQRVSSPATQESPQKTSLDDQQVVLPDRKEPSSPRVSTPATQESPQKTSLNDQQVVLPDGKEPSSQRVSTPATQESPQKTSLNDQQVVSPDRKEPSSQRISSPATQESPQKTSLNDEQVILPDRKEPSSESTEATPPQTEVTLESESDKKSESVVEAPISEPVTIDNNVDLPVESTNSEELEGSCENEPQVTEDLSVPKDISVTTEESLENSDQQNENPAANVVSTECHVRTPKDESKNASLVTNEPLIVEKPTDLLAVDTQPLQEDTEVSKTMEQDENIDSVEPQEEVIEPEVELKKQPEADSKEEHNVEANIKSEKSLAAKEDVEMPLEIQSDPVITDERDAEIDNSPKIAEVKFKNDDAHENKVTPEVEDVEMKEAKLEEDSDTSMDRDRKDRKDRKRKRSISPQQERQRSPGPAPEDEPEIDDDAVLLSWYDSDLNLNINKDGFLSATPMHNDGFGYIWAGTRASFGFDNGKVYYEVKVTENCPINIQDDEQPHVLRVGWSVGTASTQLGEEKLSYGFGGTGKISTGCKFQDYGIPFGKDDVVGCYADMTDDTTIVLSFTVNGANQGVAFSIPKIELNGAALFPHILSKNCTFCCNFSGEDPWSKPILEGYIPVGSVELKDRICGARRPAKKEDCEVIMLCGLPAAGKTVWANNYGTQHPEKMYNILGTSNLIDKMKVMGLPRRRNYHGRWEVLIDKCGRAVNKLLEIASTRRRNYILDHTNVYPSARRRKMRNFYGFQRKAIVIVPTDEEFKLRTAKREAIEGKDIPDSAVLEMKENFTLPTAGETFDSVEFVELGEEEAKKLVEKYNREGKEAGQHFVNKRPRLERVDSHRESRDSRNSRDSRDSRDYRDRRGGYPDRTRNTSGWRGSGNNGVGWRDRPQRGGNGGGGGHPRHGGGYGPASGGGWRGRGGPPTQSPQRSRNDRRGGSSSVGGSAGNDRRPGGDRNRLQQRQGGGWGAMGYQSSQQQQSSSSWGGQQGSWSGSQTQQGWGQQGGWGQQQWGGWKGFGQGTYGQASYGQQNYGNGNWGGWNQQYYNQYWGQQQQQSAQSTGGQITTTTGTTTTTNSSPTYGYAQGWQGYAHTYTFPGNTSTTNTQDQQSQQQK